MDRELRGKNRNAILYYYRRRNGGLNGSHYARQRKTLKIESPAKAEKNCCRNRV